MGQSRQGLKYQDRQLKVWHWRGVWGLLCSKGAPVLVFTELGNLVGRGEQAMRFAASKPADDIQQLTIVDSANQGLIKV